MLQLQAIWTKKKLIKCNAFCQHDSLLGEVTVLLLKSVTGRTQSIYLIPAHFTKSRHSYAGPRTSDTGKDIKRKLAI